MRSRTAAGSNSNPGRDPSRVPIVRTIRVPHDCDPTFALGIEHRDRHLALVSDMGEPREDVASALENPHVLLLEANHDVHAPSRAVPAASQGSRRRAPGHLSNDQMAVMLTRMVGPRTHTVVLIHLSAKNNTPELALDAARAALARLGRPEIRVVAATQHEPLEPIDV